MKQEAKDDTLAEAKSEDVTCSECLAAERETESVCEKIRVYKFIVNTSYSEIVLRFLLDFLIYHCLYTLLDLYV
jgi:hypothetical protein